MSIHIHGELEIDHERGVIYFHSTAQGRTILRICGLPKRTEFRPDEDFIDITHMKGATYHG